MKIKGQLVDYYLKQLGNITEQYANYNIEIRSPNAFHGRYLLQRDYVDIEFSVVFTKYQNYIQHQNSQRANSIFTKDAFSIIYSYLSKIEQTESQGDSPVQRSRHTTVGNKIASFSESLNTIQEKLTNNKI